VNGYQEAEQMIELGLSAEPLIEDTEKLLGLLDYLADIYYENGEYKKAQPLFEKALAINITKPNPCLKKPWLFVRTLWMRRIPMWQLLLIT
jgi:tetratricopeptide (TPR) repeat protein